MSSGEALISFPIVSSERSQPQNQRKQKLGGQRGELSWNLGFSRLAVSDSYQDDFKEERKREAVEVGLELQSAGQRGGCAIDTGDELPELILYIKVAYGAHCGGGQNSRGFHLDRQPSHSSLLQHHNILLLCKSKLSKKCHLGPGYPQLTTLYMSLFAASWSQGELSHPLWGFLHPVLANTDGRPAPQNSELRPQQQSSLPPCI